MSRGVELAATIVFIFFLFIIAFLIHDYSQNSCEEKGGHDISNVYDKGRVICVDDNGRRL